MNQTEYGRVDHLYFGTNQIGVPYVESSGTWFRKDLYTSNANGEQTVERRFAANRDDLSPVFYGKYDSSCPACFLNHSHTKAYHDKELHNARRRERDQVMRDMGLKKVRGNLGGTYWE